MADTFQKKSDEELRAAYKKAAADLVAQFPGLTESESLRVIEAGEAAFDAMLPVMVDKLEMFFPDARNGDTTASMLVALATIRATYASQLDLMTKSFAMAQFAKSVLASRQKEQSS